ncbi:MAG: helix-turn-helix domain-containing protein [Oscillospiraceae bacterium]|nr:helix-turn-helix domain-containing protein [Oscillospiraceae bacterium]
MIITLQLLANRVGKQFPLRHNRTVWGENALKAPMVPQPDTDLQTCYVYITDAASFPRHIPAGASVICAGDPGVEADSYDLLICDGAGRDELLNCVQSCFYSLLEWKDAMLRSANQEMDMQKLLDLAQQEIDLRFIYLNRSYTPIAGAQDEASPSELHSLVARLMISNKVNHNEPMEQSTDILYEELGLRCLMINFHYNGSYRGKLLGLCGAEQERGEWEKPLLDVLFTCIRQVYRLYSASSLRPAGYQMMQRALRNLLEGYGVPQDMDRIRQESTRALQELEWNVNDFYVLYFIPYNENDQLAARSEFLVTSLENRWNTLSPHSSRGVALTNGICWVVNVSRPADVTFESFLPDFRSYLEELGATCGVSSVGNDFFSMHTYKTQAAMAARLGAKARPGERVHLFSDYALDYIISNATLSFPPENVLHPCLYTLSQYDRENNSEFCKTLRVYMQCQYNVLRASSMLYVHRSTFSVRLKRIESLCGIDLEDERTRLHILLSFYIMDANGISYL